MKDLKEVGCDEIEAMTEEAFEEYFSGVTAADVERMDYGLKYFSATHRIFYPRAKRMLALIEKKKVEVPFVPIERVKCDCGHMVVKSYVMTASMGTSCSHCYDRMSN